MTDDRKRHDAPAQGIPVCDLPDELAALESRLRKVEGSVIAISGEDGKNGKVGALKERMDKADSRKWTAMSMLVTIALAAVGATFWLNRWIGRIETDVAALKARGERQHRFYPADAPGKVDSQ